MRRFSLVLLLIGLCWDPAAAQQPQLGIQAFGNLNLTPPPIGARSVAMAGTGIGMPDDAGAAALNPAAMRLLVRAEVAGHFRLYTPYARAIANPTLPPGFAPEDIAIDWFEAGRHEEIAIAVAVPVGRVAVGGFYAGGETGATGFQRAGGSIAYALHPSLSVGGGIVMNIVDTGVGYCRDQTTPVALFSCPITVVGSAVAFDAGEGVDIRLGIQFGLSWSPTPRIAVGAVHRPGTNHPFTTISYGSGLSRLTESTAELHIPDQTGAGIGIRVTELFRVVLDVARVRHSQAEPGILSVLTPITTDLAPFSIRDGTELRLGAEYAIPFRDNVLVLRGGVWREPSGGVRYDGTNPFWRVLLPIDPPTAVHGTAGAGFGNSRFEAAVGVDLGESLRALVVSGLVRFK
jgi:hypothetical protein